MPRCGRDEVLARVRRALRTPTDAHVKASTLAGEGSACAGPVTGPVIGPVLVPVMGTHGERMARFAERSLQLRTRFEVVDSLEAARAVVGSIADEEGWGAVAVSGESGASEAVDGIGCPVVRTDKRYDPAVLERCDAGVTGCVALVAETGSVLVTCVDNGGRAVSVLPPHHVVIARAGQLVAGLREAFGVLRTAHPGVLPSQVSFITGPSRTGDIERILVLGAHGPRRLTVVLIDDADEGRGRDD